jgi:GTP-binding protein HflX
LISDTIGFVSRLPHQLVASFAATLEEVASADLLVHVRDMSHPATSRQKSSVFEVLKNVGVSDESEFIHNEGLLDIHAQVARL